MAWEQPATKETYKKQYQAFIKDTFYHLDTAIGADRIIRAGYNLDNTLLDDLRMVNFTPLIPNDPGSVQRAKDLNLVHGGFMGALEKSRSMELLELLLTAPKMLRLGSIPWISL